MTAPPDATDSVDGRFYVFNAGTDAEERLRSVTAALDTMSKDGLTPWAGGLTAAAAFANLPQLVAAVLVGPCGRTYARCAHQDGQTSCEGCPCWQCQGCWIRRLRERYEVESARRTDEGSRLHHVIYMWASTGVWPDADDDIAVYVDSFQRMVADYGIVPDDFEVLEATVVNREYGYAGTLDGMVWIRRERGKAAADLLDRLTPDGHERLAEALLIVDYKSREKPDRAIYADKPLQLAAYRFAPVLRLADGTEVPPPVPDAAAIVQVRPDVTRFELVLADKPEFEAFLHYLGADEWCRDRGRKAISSRTFSFAPSVVKARAADARKAKAKPTT